MTRQQSVFLPNIINSCILVWVLSLLLIYSLVCVYHVWNRNPESKPIQPCGSNHVYFHLYFPVADWEAKAQ